MRDAFTYGELKGNEKLAEQMLQHADALHLNADERKVLADISSGKLRQPSESTVAVARRSIEELREAQIRNISESSIPASARFMTVAELEVLAAGDSSLLKAVVGDTDKIQATLKQYEGLSLEEKRNTFSAVEIPVAGSLQNFEGFVTNDLIKAREKIDHLSDPIKRELVATVEKAREDLPEAQREAAVVASREKARNGREDFYAQLEANRAAYAAQKQQEADMLAAVQARDAKIATAFKEHQARIAADAQAGKDSGNGLLASVISAVGLGGWFTTSAQAATPEAEPGAVAPAPTGPAPTGLDLSVGP
ncbi:MAG: hypothetical protein U1E36_02050 [Rickettsiales bacterium]